MYYYVPSHAFGKAEHLAENSNNGECASEFVIWTKCPASRQGLLGLVDPNQFGGHGGYQGQARQVHVHCSSVSTRTALLSRSCSLQPICTSGFTGRRVGAQRHTPAVSGIEPRPVGSCAANSNESLQSAMHSGCLGRSRQEPLASMAWQ